MARRKSEREHVGQICTTPGDLSDPLLCFSDLSAPDNHAMPHGRLLYGMSFGSDVAVSSIKELKLCLIAEC